MLARTPATPAQARHLTASLPPPSRQIDYWKEQAGLPPHKRDYVDLEEIVDAKQNGAGGLPGEGRGCAGSGSRRCATCAPRRYSTQRCPFRPRRSGCRLGVSLPQRQRSSSSSSSLLLTCRRSCVE